MITINKWFSKNAKFPLFLLGIGTIVLQLCFISYIYIIQSIDQKKSVENLFTVANLALEQKNRPVLESTFAVAIEELGAEYIVLCNNNKTVMTLPFGKFNCSNLPPTDIFTRHLKFDGIGRPDYQFHFYVPVLHMSKSYLILFGISLGFFILTIVIILRVQKRFSKDILWPLENKLLSEDKINIIQIDELREKIKKISAVKEKEAAASAILEHKVKIAHNIRSLVQTLKSLQPSIQEKLAPAKKKLFVDVVEGIGDILTDFSTTNTATSGSTLLNSSKEGLCNAIETTGNNRVKVDIADVVKSTVKQKRFEFKSIDKMVSISSSIDEDLDCCFIDVDEVEFRSILSNIINNAFEVESKSAKKIKILVSKLDDKVCIRVSDNGQGIPEEVQSSLFSRGITSGKPKGTGYGLFHAKSFLGCWDGSINVENTSVNGTTILLKVPCWNPSSIKFSDGDTIVILDDDSLVHELWNTHIDSWKKSTGYSITLKSFFDPILAEEWITNSEINYAKTVFLIDNDLGKDFQTGCSIIKSFGIEDISTLVTNRYDDKELNNFCNQNSINLLPKPYLFVSDFIYVLTKL